MSLNIGLFPEKWKRVWCSEQHFLSHGAGPYFVKKNGSPYA